MTRKILILLFISFLIESFILFPQVEPSWWEIEIHLETIGDYPVKEGKKAYDGHYSFTLLWTGCMERDMDDYLIYHEASKLLQWEAQNDGGVLLWCSRQFWKIIQVNESG